MLLNSRLTHFYSITSFIIIFVTAAVLTLFYRQITIEWIFHIAETSNRTVAQATLSSVRPELVAYLDTQATAAAHPSAIRPLENEPATVIRRLAQDNAAGTINIFDRHGQLVFSTRPQQIDINQANNPRFKSALHGHDASSMIYRDTINSFEGSSVEDNLMETFIPVRNGPDEPVLGVLEIHTDMNHLIEENNTHLLIFLIGAEIILAVLYSILVFIVRYANGIIDSQQKDFQERTATLEILSRHLLKNEEQKKQKIAFDLHEGIAQTLSAIKYNVEISNNRIKTMDANLEPLEAIVPAIQDAIHEVRTIATRLRPPCLDELGLLPTINWFCREFEQQHEGIVIDKRLSLPEAIIPAPLKIVIYRIIESTLKDMAVNSSTDQISLTMRSTDDQIELHIDDIPAQQSFMSDFAPFGSDRNLQFRFAEMKERTFLSGGRFTSRDIDGWVTLRAAWNCQAVATNPRSMA